jgi:hypothetical protein
MRCIYFVATSFLGQSIADLPIHCELPRFAGSWIFGEFETSVHSASEARRCGEYNLYQNSVPINLGSSSSLHLADNPYREAFSLIISDFESWSPLYGEGLVLKKDNPDGSFSIFYGQFHYSCGDGMKSSSPVEPDGTTPGCETDCGRISRGWVLKQDKAGSRSLHCFSGYKVSSDSTNTEIHRALRSESSLRWLSSIHRHDEQFSTFLRPFSAEDRQPDGCGSCYVQSFAYAFENSIALKTLLILQKHHVQAEFGEEVEKWNLDRGFMLGCSFSAERCNGGYFETLTVDMMYLGIPLKDAISPDDICSLSGESSSIHGDPARIYPKLFVQLQSEGEIMDYLQSNGPVLVGVHMDTTASSTGDRIIPIRRHERNRSEFWDYLNHGLVITGWGAEGTAQYWTVYNSWGEMQRIERGPASEWFYKYAVGVEPDFCRGKLFIYLQERIGPDGAYSECQSASAIRPDLLRSI